MPVQVSGRRPDLMHERINYVREYTVTRLGGHGRHHLPPARMDSAVRADGGGRDKEAARHTERHSVRHRNGLLVHMAISRLRRQLDRIYRDLLFQEA